MSLRSAVLRDARLRWREVDIAALSPRIASAVFVVAGLLGLCLDVLLPSDSVDRMSAPTALIAVAGGIAGILAPWPRWSGRAQLLIPIGAFATIAFGGLHGDLAAPFLAVLPLPFVFVGFTQRPGTNFMLAPVAALALVVGARFEASAILVSALVFALPMSVLVGEAIVQVQLRRTRAERRIGRLLDAVRVLARVNDERTGARLVASLTASFLEADAVAVLLADRPRSSTFRSRALFGHPALADAAPLVIDSKVDPERMHPGETTFLPDASQSPLLDAPGAGGRVRAAALLPLGGRDNRTIGVVVAMWGTTRTRLAPSAVQAAELLAQEAGRMFQRLQVTAALERDAETDPLTELANRRTFTRALETLRPGDAVVIVDLDRFKSVNDRFGHEVGDRVLRALARCLQNGTRQVDCVARYGGEEFALVLPDADTKGARIVLARVRRAWAALDPLTTFSAGVAVHEAGMDPHHTLRRADGALYSAKEAGRDRDMLAPQLTALAS